MKIKLPVVASFGGDKMGEVDIFRPNTSYNYQQIASEFSLQYRLSQTANVGAGYRQDIWGRNINKNNRFFINLSWRQLENNMPLFRTISLP